MLLDGINKGLTLPQIDGRVVVSMCDVSIARQRVSDIQIEA